MPYSGSIVAVGETLAFPELLDTDVEQPLWGSKTTSRMACRDSGLTIRLGEPTVQWVGLSKKLDLEKDEFCDHHRFKKGTRNQSPSNKVLRWAPYDVVIKYVVFFHKNPFQFLKSQLCWPKCACYALH